LDEKKIVIYKKKEDKLTIGPGPPREILQGRTRLCGDAGAGWDFYQN
jgi:hypothetical protein